MRITINEVLDALLTEAKKGKPKKKEEARQAIDGEAIDTFLKALSGAFSGGSTPSELYGQGMDGSAPEERQRFIKYVVEPLVGTTPSVREAVQKIQNLVNTQDQRLTTVGEILAALDFLMLMTNIINNYNPATAGFLNEMILAPIIGAYQVADKRGGTLPIEDIDYATQEGTPISLKTLSGSTAIKGSYFNLLTYYLNRIQAGLPSIIKYVIVKKDKDKTSLTFYEKDIGVLDLLEIDSNIVNAVKKYEGAPERIIMVEKQIKELSKYVEEHPEEQDKALELRDLEKFKAKLELQIKFLKFYRRIVTADELTSEEVIELRDLIKAGALGKTQFSITQSKFSKEEPVGQISIGEEQIRKVATLYAEQLNDVVTPLFVEVNTLVDSLRDFFVTKETRRKSSHAWKAIQSSKTLSQKTPELRKLY